MAKEYPELGTEILGGLTKKLNAVATTVGTFIALVNDFDKTIERTPVQTPQSYSS